jgi:hypothetical protein
MEEMSCDIIDFGCHLSSLWQQFGDFFNWIWETILGAMLSVLSLIPVPAWLASPSFNLPDGVMWFASVLQLQVIRFAIRRLPVIG